MGVPSRHILSQGPVLAALGRTLAGAVQQRVRANTGVAHTPGPELQTRHAPLPRAHTEDSALPRVSEQPSSSSVRSPR